MEFKLLNLGSIGKIFQRFKSKDEVEREQEAVDQSVGMSQEQLDSINYDGNYQIGSVIHAEIDFDELFNSKKERVVKYREMALSPEVSEAIDNTCDEAVYPDQNGDIFNLNTDSSIPKNIQKKIRLDFEYVVHDLMNMQEKCWELFNKWLIEGELYLEVIINKDQDNLIDYKVLPAWTMFPVYDGTKIVRFIQKVKSDNNKEEERVFNSNQIVYIKSTDKGRNNLDVRGYLERAIKPYNQLRSLEDSLIVYRIARAPERKLWNIDVGRMPKGKAEEFIKKMIHTYKKNSLYDPNTGKVDITANIQSMSEDYWFAKTADGRGTTVDTIGGATNLGELDDVKYFKEKLFQALKLPRTRWDKDQSGTYSSGRTGEILREEVKFARFVNRLQNTFKYVVIQPFMLLLKMRGIDEKYLNPSLYNITMNKSNYTVEYQRIELLEARAGMLTTYSSYIRTPENKNEPEAMFSKEMVMREYFGMSDEEWDKNQEYIEKEEKATEQEPPPEVEPTASGDTASDDSEQGDVPASTDTTSADDPTNKSPLSVAQGVSKEEDKEEKKKKLIVDKKRGFKDYLDRYK